MFLPEPEPMFLVLSGVSGSYLSLKISASGLFEGLHSFSYRKMSILKVSRKSNFFDLWNWIFADL